MTFLNHRATLVKADGTDILSATMHLRGEMGAEAHAGLSWLPQNCSMKRQVVLYEIMRQDADDASFPQTFRRSYEKPLGPFHH